MTPLSQNIAYVRLMRRTAEWAHLMLERMTAVPRCFRPSCEELVELVERRRRRLEVYILQRWPKTYGK